MKAFQLQHPYTSPQTPSTLEMSEGADATASIIQRRRMLLTASQNRSFPYEVVVGGLRFEVDRNVFSPSYFESTDLFCEMFPYRNEERVLDMGCGCGAFAVHAALRGARHVDAVDIVPEAVANTLRNAIANGVAGRLSAWRSDLFDSVLVRYDTIFWNCPWVYVAGTYKHQSALELSVLDPGYKLIGRFLADARAHLLPQGRLFLGFADFGNTALLETLAETASYRLQIVAEKQGKLPERYKYMIYRLL